MSYDQKFLESLPVIDRAIAFVARKRGLSKADAEDFGADIKLKLIGNDYGIFREYRGTDGGLPAYLQAIVSNFVHDWCNAKWGRWRPTAEACRQGPVAVGLERLTHRDGWTFEEACSLLRSELGSNISNPELAQIAETLPRRERRTLLNLDTVMNASDGLGTSEDQALRNEKARRAREAVDALRAALASLEAEDRLIVRMRFCDNVQIVKIARVLSLEQKPLYRRIAAILRGIGMSLEEQGVSEAEVLDLLAEGWPETPDEGRLFFVGGRTELI